MMMNRYGLTTVRINNPTEYQIFIGLLNHSEIFYLIELAYKILNDDFLVREYIKTIAFEEEAETVETMVELETFKNKINAFIESDEGYRGLSP